LRYGDILIEVVRRPIGRRLVHTRHMPPGDIRGAIPGSLAVE
jgi:hypothetical protein